MATCFPSALSIFLLAGAQGCGLDLACRQGCVELLGYHLHVYCIPTCGMGQRKRLHPIIRLLCAWACGHATAGPLGFDDLKHAEQIPYFFRPQVSELPIFVRRLKNQSVSLLLFTTHHKAPETETTPGPASPIPP
ncbi:hypothetical protein CI102_10916 [Trichoderma harzianum]|nr:hypothetical protein CI102_10916 [Trichoderma harzianum]